MASLTRWTWVWVNPGSWWWTGGLACFDSWGLKESDTTERLNWLTDWCYFFLPPFHFSSDRSSFLSLIPKLFFPILFLWWLLAFNLRPKLISTYVYWFLKLTILMLFCLSACILNFSNLAQNGRTWLACVYFLSSFLYLQIGLFWQWKCGALTTGPAGKSLP